MDKTMLDFYCGKRVFVTGHTGFKGAWLCRILVNAGAVVTGYALEPADFERILEELGQPFQNPLDQFRTTELRCIVVTED